MATKVKAGKIAAPYLEEVRAEVAQLDEPLRLVGILSSDTQASDVYANYAAQGCEKVGIEFDELTNEDRSKIDQIVRALRADGLI